MLVIEFKCTDKRCAQLREKVERAAEKGDVSADRLSAGQARDGLIDNRLKNRCGKVFLCCALVDQRLDVRFCEDTAACCDRVEGLVIFRILI